MYLFIWIPWLRGFHSFTPIHRSTLLQINLGLGVYAHMYLSPQGPIRMYGLSRRVTRSLGTTSAVYPENRHRRLEWSLVYQLHFGLSIILTLTVICDIQLKHTRKPAFSKASVFAISGMTEVTCIFLAMCQEYNQARGDGMPWNTQFFWLESSSTAL